MSTRDDVKRIAEATADFYNDHAAHDLETFVKTYWAPDVQMYHGGRGTPSSVDDFLKMHSAEAGFDWRQTHMEVRKLVVGDDSFVIQMDITQWRSHEADGIDATSDTSSEAALPGYQDEPIPAINFYTVGDGKVVRIDSYVFLSVALLAAGAARF